MQVEVEIDSDLFIHADIREDSREEIEALLQEEPFVTLTVHYNPGTIDVDYLTEDDFDDMVFEINGTVANEALSEKAFEDFFEVLESSGTLDEVVEELEDKLVEIAAEQDEYDEDFDEDWV